MTLPPPSLRLIRHLARYLSLLLLWPALAHPAGWDLDQLMGELAQIRSGRASFVEKKTIALLDKPVESSGELLFTAPDHLEKRTLLPRPETMVLDHGTLTIERGRQKHQLQLSDYPELAAFIDSIRGTLAGDRAALERSYRLSLEGSSQNWTLQLLPTDEGAAVRRIRIAGIGNTVRRIEIVQADGDRSVMRVDPLPGP